MGTRNDGVRGLRLSRRHLVRAGAGAAGAATFGAHHGRSAARGGQDGGSIVFLSTQLRPVEEAEKVRGTILAGFDRPVEFIGEDTGPFTDRVLAEAQAGQGEVGLLGGQHGDFATFVEDGLLSDLSDLAEELSDRGFVEQYLELGRYGGEQLSYIPWMQATYVMVAHREALAYLPEGVDESALQTSLTYDQLAAWARNVNDAEGQKLGFPAGEDGLLHRFLQGYGYPSFTGGVNTTFAGDDAVAMWQWFRDAWATVNPQALGYNAMDEPLISGEVWIAWDHTARLIGALRERGPDLIAFPAPRGPRGLGYMPVVAGLAVPASAPDVEASRALIEYLTRPEVQATTLREVAFFPVIEGDLPTDLPEGVQAEVAAVQATTGSEDALASLLPVGLGDQAGAYNKVFRDSFQSIVLDGNDIRAVLDEQAANLQGVLDAAQAPCWAPDPEGDGVCQVG